jgi:hypothetical protein
MNVRKRRASRHKTKGNAFRRTNSSTAGDGDLIASSSAKEGSCWASIDDLSEGSGIVAYPVDVPSADNLTHIGKGPTRDSGKGVDNDEDFDRASRDWSKEQEQGGRKGDRETSSGKTDDCSVPGESAYVKRKLAEEKLEKLRDEKLKLALLASRALTLSKRILEIGDSVYRCVMVHPASLQLEPLFFIE